MSQQVPFIEIMRRLVWDENTIRLWFEVPTKLSYATTRESLAEQKVLVEQWIHAMITEAGTKTITEAIMTAAATHRPVLAAFEIVDRYGNGTVTYLTW